MAEATERAAAAIAHQPLSVDAYAEIYRGPGEIVTLNDDDLGRGDEEEVVALTVDANNFVRVMDEAADRLESQARTWNKEADEIETLISQRADWILELQEEYGSDLELQKDLELQEEYGTFCEAAQEGERYSYVLPRDEAISAQQQDLDEAHKAYKRLEFLEDEVAELQEQEEGLRSEARRAQDDAARKRAVARRLVAMREVVSEARRKADAAVAKARKRVMAATLADDDDSLPNDRTAELLERFADLVGSEAVRRLSTDPAT